MTDYRYSEIEQQLNAPERPYADLDMVKLNKLDRLLTKIDDDFKKKQKEITKPKLVEIMKTTHEIYQIVLYEISEMLEAARLSDLRQSLNKIYNGQNLILNYILKLNTNFEVQADKMMETLQKSVQSSRRKSVGQSEQESKETAKIANQMVQLQPIVKKLMKKTYADKATDCTEDMKDARSKENLAKKQEELDQMQVELDEGGKQLEEFLKNRKVELLSIGESKAQNNLKEVLKDLSKKKRETNEIEDEAMGYENAQQAQKDQMQQLQASLQEGIKGMQKQHQEKTIADIKSGKALFKNGVLVYMENRGVETDKEIEPKENLIKSKKEANERDQKALALEKRIKDITIERDAYAGQIQGFNQKITQVNLEKKKLEDTVNTLKKQQQQATEQHSLSKGDQEKIKKLVEENIKMKLRVKTLLDNISALETEMNRNYERFRLFITNHPSLTEDQKKAILTSAENLFKINISQKLNVNEMKEIVAMDDLLKDPMFKQICGQDLVSMTRQVKKDEQVRKQKIARNPNYDPMFDAEFLNADEKIIVRRVIKMVKRLNSQGEWIEEEQEVEEEVVVNAEGQEVRKREKPIVVQQSKETQQFMDAHGGFAIGGAKIKLPSKPMAKDGKEVKMGEWFEDKSGKKMRKVQGKEGEEQYEVEEEYIDEYGRKKTRTKVVKIRKDKNGNEIIEEESIGADGRKQRIARKVTKDKDGNDLIEEVTVDENGNRVTKKQKISKDKDGNEVIEEEIVDAQGKKTIRKVFKDSNGNEVIVEETTDSKGNRIVTTKKKNAYGEDVIDQQIIDKSGKIKTVEKKTFVDQDGATVFEEVCIDAKGQKITKKTKVSKDADGNEIVEEIITNADGSITVKKVKKIINKDGTEEIVEELVDAQGNVTVVKKKITKDKNGNTITEEERIDGKTGETIITKTVRDFKGREQVQQQKISKDGKIVNVQKNVTVDQDGIQIETEEQEGEDGQKLNIQRKVYKDKDGKQIQEEIITDEQGNKKMVKKYKDKDGHEVSEEIVENADGSKKQIKKKVYKDKDGNEITEIETTDEKGNKVVFKTKKAANGEETVEETRIGADGKIEKKISKVKIDKNGNQIIEETIIAADGSKTVKISKIGCDQRSTQTDGIWGGEKLTIDQLLQQLSDLGMDRSKLEQLKNQIMLKQQISTKKQQQKIQQQQEPEEIVRPASADSQKSLESLDDEEDEDNQADRLFNRMMNNNPASMVDIMRQIRGGLAKPGNEKITKEEFREYMAKMRQVHQKCGDPCPHLKRFYEKLGYVQSKYKRRYLRMKDTRIEAKNKLPQIQQNQSTTKF